MDLAKIIIELRAELQCLDAAIASIEELARAQNIAEAYIRPQTSAGLDSVPPDPGPENTLVKRRRGRPRKNEPESDGDAPNPIGPGSAQPGGGSTASVA